MTDLAEALSVNSAAKRHFEVFPPPSKKTIYWWIESAKRPATRQKRVEETVRLAEQNTREISSGGLTSKRAMAPSYWFAACLPPRL